ncbi:hypothetical protein H6F67_25730 [Microcoleus sp. FACHB-1515]|uniref:hypothetical protein n=1 Tax=Cyanophyceae TaxID=3028117 RepID=UPI0016840C2D|nr:hypothetical protein [Microcoleus sp. FACHB-1515]MBD2093249.1 hypothetical protein [Microcoleus sp. FACHB-1515]
MLPFRSLTAATVLTVSFAHLAIAPPAAANSIEAAADAAVHPSTITSAPRVSAAWDEQIPGTGTNTGSGGIDLNFPIDAGNLPTRRVSIGGFGIRIPDVGSMTRSLEAWFRNLGDDLLGQILGNILGGDGRTGGDPATGTTDDKDSIDHKDLGDLFGDLGVPDVEKIRKLLLDRPTSTTEATQLAEVLQNRIPGSGSYIIRQEVAQAGVRELANQMAEAATLSKPAQAELALEAVQAQATTEQNAKLADESQHQDVSQHILQNLSAQSGLSASIEFKQLKEAWQARVDRAYSNVLNAQQAHELAVVNTADRREAIGTGNAANIETALITLPGGYYLGSPGKSR